MAFDQTGDIEEIQPVFVSVNQINCPIRGDNSFLISVTYGFGATTQSIVYIRYNAQCYNCDAGTRQCTQKVGFIVDFVLCFFDLTLVNSPSSWNNSPLIL